MLVRLNIHPMHPNDIKWIILDTKIDYFKVVRFNATRKVQNFEVM